jgi:hypothetical protein
MKSHTRNLRGVKKTKEIDKWEGLSKWKDIWISQIYEYKQRGWGFYIQQEQLLKEDCFHLLLPKVRAFSVWYMCFRANVIEQQIAMDASRLIRHQCVLETWEAGFLGESSKDIWIRSNSADGSELTSLHPYLTVQIFSFWNKVKAIQNTKRLTAWL